MLSRNGWLPYGASDPSIILQHPLTSDPAAYFATIGTYTLQGTGHLYDSVKGFCPNGTGGHRIVSLTGRLPLDEAGQISVQMERAWLCKNILANYSFGYVPAAAETFLSALGSAVSKWVIKDPTGTQWASGPVGAGIDSPVHSPGKGDFVTVNYGWSGGKVGGTVWMAIDGQVVQTVSRNSATLSDLMANLYIGSDRAIPGSFPAQYYFRNLQISTLPPMFSTVPLLRHIGMISDSLLYSDLATSNYNDVVSSYTMRRELANRGLYPEKITLTTEGGARLDDSLGGVQYIKTQLTTLLALKPTVVIIRGGTNDATGGRCSQAGWQAQVTAYITDCMAEPSVRRVFFLGIPSAIGNTATNTPTFQSERALGDTKMQAAVDAWRASNPTDPRDVVFVSDMYSRLGGESPAPGTYIGQVAGTYTDLHLSGYGHYLHGKAIADWLVSELSNY